MDEPIQGRPMRLLLIILLLFDVNPSQGRSCSGTENRIVADCNAGTCSELFFVEEVKINSYCQRIPKIIETPGWAKSAIEYELAHADFNELAGVYQLTISADWFPGFAVNSFEDYLFRKSADNRSYDIGVELKQLSGTSYVMVLADWQLKTNELWSQHHQTQWWGWFWTSLTFVVLLISVVLFVLGVHAYNKACMATALVIQFGLFVLMLNDLNQQPGEGIWLIMLCYPGILLYELVLGVCLWVNNRKSRVT